MKTELPQEQSKVCLIDGLRTDLFSSKETAWVVARMLSALTGQPATKALHDLATDAADLVRAERAARAEWMALATDLHRELRDNPLRFIQIRQARLKFNELLAKEMTKTETDT